MLAFFWVIILKLIKAETVLKYRGLENKDRYLVLSLPMIVTYLFSSAYDKMIW